MIYTYDECIQKYKSDYQINKAIEKRELFKIEPGIYSNRKTETEAAVLMKKYPYAIFTLNSAFYYHGLTDSIPENHYLSTDKDATKISERNVKQSFDNSSFNKLGMEMLEYNGDILRVFSRERLLIELVRNRSKIAFEYYKEIIGNYRKIINELDFQTIEEYAEKLPKTALVMKTIRMEVL